ncbi:hypothetical protein ACT6CD_08540 [Campylobacter coli]|uniref:hypothetical protein n=1 Tax=Campylobacter coli TaxID=195 RepID=UPI0040341BFC
MADMIDSGKISFACELDKDLETPTTESNTEARITFTETQIVLGLGNDKSIKYKATGQGTDLSNYYNRSEVDEKLKLKADKTQLGNYYNKGEVDSSLGNKVDTTTLTTDYYNKTETDNLLSNKADTTVLENYYNKSDIDSKLTNKVDTTTLDNYDLSTEVDNKVKVVSDKVGDLSTLETGVKNTVVAAINEVKRAQTEAGKVTNLNDLGDVNASAPRRGQFLGWDQDTSKWVSKDVETDGMDTHMSDFNNPHRTTISNLNDTTINTPKVNQVLVYNGTKWINKDVSLDDSNYAKKNEANIFTKNQSGIDGTEDANFVTLRQLKTKVGLTGDETIGGNKTFSSPITIPNATANNHSLPLGQADSRYTQLLTQQLDLTVGTGLETTTHFNSLQKALNYAVTLKPKGNIRVVITLKSGFILEEQIVMKDKNYSFIRIESEDDEVEAKGENAKQDFGVGIGMIYTVNCANSAEFNCVFKMSIAGKEKCPVGFALVNSSACYMQKGGFKNCKIGLRVNIGCTASLKNCDFSGSTQYGIFSGMNSIVQLSYPIMRDCPSSTTLLRAFDNGEIQIHRGIHRRGSDSAKISNITPNDRSSLDGFIYGSVTVNLDN